MDLLNYIMPNIEWVGSWQNALKKMDFIMGELPQPEAQAFRSSYFTDNSHLIQREWHQKWHPRFRESLHNLGAKEFEDIVSQSSIRCYKGKRGHSPRFRESIFCPAEGDNFEKVVIIAPDHSYVYKFFHEESFLRLAKDIQIETQKDPPVPLSMLAKFRSPLEMLLQFQEQRCLDCFEPSEALFLEDRGLVFRQRHIGLLLQQRHLKEASERQFSRFVQNGLFNEKFIEGIFLAQNGQMIHLWDLTIENCGYDKGMKLIDGTGQLLRLQSIPISRRPHFQRALEYLESHVPEKARIGVHEGELETLEMMWKIYSKTQKTMLETCEKKIKLNDTKPIFRHRIFSLPDLNHFSKNSNHSRGDK